MELISVYLNVKLPICKTCQACYSIICELTNRHIKIQCFDVFFLRKPATFLPNNSGCLIVLKESFDFQKTKIHLHNLKLKIETNWDVAGPRLDIHQKMPYWICNAIASNQLRPNLVIFNCYRYYLLGIPKCKKEV